jgi:farnesyl-diphosphate farnesyltransferase
MSAWVATGYLLCRTADTIEDEASIDPETRAELLDTYDDVLDTESAVDVDDFLAEVEAVHPEAPNDDWDVLFSTDRTIRVLHSFDPAVQEAMRGVTREMAQGMADMLRRHADTDGLRLGSVDELEEYCWYVAGTVGELWTGLIEVYKDPGSPGPDHEDARSFALLLQLVNIAKDVRADWEEENNVYLPEEWLAEEGIDHEAVADPEETDAVARVVRRVTDHAAEHAPGARRYLTDVPREQGLLGSMSLPYLLAIGTIRELNGRTEDAVEQNDAVKLERHEVEALFAEMASDPDQDDVSEIEDIVLDQPYQA